MSQCETKKMAAMFVSVYNHQFCKERFKNLTLKLLSQTVAIFFLLSTGK